MRFKVTYKVGTSEREKTIVAKDLEEAETICNEKFTKWTDIIMLDKTKGEKVKYEN
jgi:hypothetical protein